MTTHPRERSFGQSLSRRDFLRRSAALGIAMPSLASVLAACGRPDERGSGPSISGTGFTGPARRENPVELPIHDDLQPIADGLEPEQGATLQIYNWDSYLFKGVIKEFCSRYDCDFEYTTFNNMEEAVQKIVGGQVADVFMPTVDVLGRLAATKLLQPLNHAYLPSASNAWSVFTDPGPWYDLDWRYTVPYTVYSTGVGYRRDRVPDEEADAKGYDLVWDPRFAGKVGLLDSYREGLGTALLRSGVTDVNTGDGAAIETAKEALVELVALDVRVDVNYYATFAEKYTVHHGWGTDFVSNANFYLPPDLPADVVGFWFPPDDKGVVGNDTMAIPASAEHPVLAHLFLNFLLEDRWGYENWAWLGYPGPLNSLTPDALVEKGDVPEHLKSALVSQDRWEAGFSFGELDPDVDQTWLAAWQEFKLSTG